MATKRVLIWGGRSQARLVLEMIRAQGLGDVQIIFDNTLECLKFATDIKFIGDPGELKIQLDTVDTYAVCIGGEFGYARVMTARQLDELGLAPMSIVDPNALIDPTATIGSGLLAMPGSIVHKFCRIGNHVVVNTGATIDHECIVGDGVHVMGSCSISGRVTVDHFATLGTNATVLPDLTIGEGAFIGAGAVLTKDAEPYTVYTGIPARPVRGIERKFDDHALRQIIEDPA